MPVATAIAPSRTVPTGPPPPPQGASAKKRSAGMPRLAARLTTSLLSMLYLVMPSMSDGLSPASAIALPIASTARLISLRPESLEYSVWPTPTIAAWSFSASMVSLFSCDKSLTSRYLPACRCIGPDCVSAIGLAGNSPGAAQRADPMPNPPSLRRFHHLVAVACRRHASPMARGDDAAAQDDLISVGLDVDVGNMMT